MNLSQTMALESLRTGRFDTRKDVTLDRRDLADTVFKYARNEGRDLDMEKDEWSYRNLFSKTFTLAEVMVNRVANLGGKLHNRSIAKIAAQKETLPIVIDFNQHKMGIVASIGYTPKAVVVDGREKFAAACQQGRTKVLAWVGDKVLDAIRADHQLSSDELQQELYDLLRSVYPQQYVVGNAMPPQCWIEKVYPFENYMIYNYDNKRYRQHYFVTINKEVTLAGSPQPVALEYVDVQAQAGTIAYAMKVMQACGCNSSCSTCAAAQKQVKSCMNGSCLHFEKDGRVITLKDSVKIYNGLKGGKRAKIRAVAPPGWEDTVKHMKEHKDIQNPWALAWSMDDQGYKPHAHKNVKAGGPGSGRHKGDASFSEPKIHQALTEAGFRKHTAASNKREGILEGYEKYSKGKRSYMVDYDNGSWDHATNSGQRYATGNGHNSLITHIENNR